MSRPLAGGDGAVAFVRDLCPRSLSGGAVLLGGRGRAPSSLALLRRPHALRSDSLDLDAVKGSLERSFPDINS